MIERYGSKPFVLIFCVGKVSPKSLSVQFIQYTNNQQYSRSFPSPVWAQKCLLVFENNDDVGSYPLEPFKHYLLFSVNKRQRSLITHTAKTTPLNFYKDSERVLASNEKCLSQIKTSLTGVHDIKKAERLIEKGLTYNASVKRQLSDISTDSESDLEFPEK